MVLLVLTVYLLIDALRLSSLTGAALVVLSMTLALGVLERYIRQRALQRRRLAESGEPSSG